MYLVTAPCIEEAIGLSRGIGVVMSWVLCASGVVV